MRYPGPHARLSRPTRNSTFQRVTRGEPRVSSFKNSSLEGLLVDARAPDLELLQAIKHGLEVAARVEATGRFKRQCYALPAFSASARPTDSHFIGEACSAGWDTSRCQMSGWNDSVWGVIVAGFTVGTIRHASATLAV